ncbi:MAG: CPBP family intramembrane metalloprotease domain-containing protein [Flavobacteriales bacterium]|nr:MAG: CPBP family intramembrane metalloprotease domain-containing protein [Flavobacteriales bacterium]
MEIQESRSRSNFFLLVVLGYYLIIFLATVTFAGDELSETEITSQVSNLMKLLQGVLTLAIFGGIAVFFGVTFSQEKWKYFNMHIPPKIFTLLLAGLLVFFSLPVINTMLEWNNQLNLPEWLSGVENWMKTAESNAEKITKQFLMVNSIGDLAVNLVVMAMIPAIAEELFFRGLLQRVLIASTKNIHIGIWLAAILFSALHGQFYGFLPRMVLGAILGYLFVWSGSLWVPIFAHFVNNGAAVLLAFYVKKGMISEDVENIGMGEDKFYFALNSAFIVVLLLGWIWWRERKKQMAIE